MTRSITVISLLAAALLMALPPAASARPADGQTADVQVHVPTNAMSMPHEALRRAEIFRILQGGTPVSDQALAEHLWEVAGSLARSGWTPPRVTVSVVVRDATVRD